MKTFSNSQERKEYIKQVRQRLLNHNYGANAKIEADTQLRGYYVNGKLITGEELFGYYSKIKLIEESGLSHFAIGELIDKDIFSTMLPHQQQRYVMELAVLYKELKKSYGIIDNIKKEII